MSNSKSTASQRYRKFNRRALNNNTEPAQEGGPAAKPSASSSRKVSKPSSLRVSEKYADPLSYQHPWPSMERYAQLLALRYDRVRTRHSYYRQLRLLQEHCDCDPALLQEAQMRDYLLHVKMVKRWGPKTLRQAIASALVFFVELLGLPRWRVFDQTQTKDHDELPAVLSRQQVHDLLAHVRLRRYRTPLKLIYCCGLRLSEPSEPGGREIDSQRLPEG
mgnify:CR=1 FL=1